MFLIHRLLFVHCILRSFIKGIKWRASDRTKAYVGVQRNDHRASGMEGRCWMQCHEHLILRSIWFLISEERHPSRCVQKQTMAANLCTGLLLSIFVELSQYIFCLGLCELDDLVCNGLGTVIGYGLYKLFRCFILCWAKYMRNIKELDEWKRLRF